MISEKVKEGSIRPLKPCFPPRKRDAMLENHEKGMKTACLTGGKYSETLETTMVSHEFVEREDNCMNAQCSSLTTEHWPLNTVDELRPSSFPVRCPLFPSHCTNDIRAPLRRFAVLKSEERGEGIKKWKI
jgi:hypothetical protein